MKVKIVAYLIIFLLIFLNASLAKGIDIIGVEFVETPFSNNEAISSEGTMWQYDLAHTAAFPLFDAPFGNINLEYETWSDHPGSPVVTETIVYITDHKNIFEDGEWRNASVIRALVPDTGQELWYSAVPKNMVGLEGMLALAGDTLLANTRSCSGINAMYAFDAYSGEMKWNFLTSACNTTPPVVANQMVYFGTTNDDIYALNLENGSEIWRFQTRGNVYSSVSYYQEKIYFGDTSGKVYALDSQTGELIWQRWLGDYVDATPAVANGLVYIPADRYGLHAFLYALDTENGEVVWHQNLGGNPSNHDSPAVADGKVVIPQKDYYNIDNDKIFAFEADTGSKIWEYSGRTFFSPIICNNKIYGEGDWPEQGKDEFFALDLNTGEKIESYIINQNRSNLTSHEPFLKNGWLFHSNIWGIHVFSGGSSWQKHAPEITSSPIKETMVDSRYIYNVEAEDRDGDILTYSLIDFPEGMRMEAETGLIRWLPKYQDNGFHHIVIEVDDNNGGKDRQFFNLEVKKFYNPGLRSKIE